MRENLLSPSNETERGFQASGGESTYRSVAVLAADLGLSERSTRSALRRGEIPHIRIGRRFILPRAAIAEWLRKASLSGAFQSPAAVIERPTLVVSSGHSEVSVTRPGKIGTET